MRVTIFILKRFSTRNAVVTFRTDSEDSFTDTEISDLDDNCDYLDAANSVLKSNFIQPLNVVWAKLPESPWVPAIIIRQDRIANDLNSINIDAKMPTKEILFSKEKTSNDHLIYTFYSKQNW